MTLYDISEDPRGFVRVTLHGYWSLDVLDRFDADLDALLARREAASGGTGPVRLLMDGREQDVQSREVIEGVKRGAGNRDRAGFRVAIIVSSMLRKLQADRVSPAGANRAIFFEEDAALAWLL